MIPEPRTNAERAAVDAAMKQLRADTGFAESFTFRDVLMKWYKFVENLESHEYDLAFSDYVHDLQQRDAIEEICHALPERLCDEIKLFLNPLDNRFRFATNEIGEPLLTESACAAFWWRRVPKRVGSDFAEELANRDS